MEALGLTLEQADKTVDLLVKNLNYGRGNLDLQTVLHIEDLFFAVVEDSLASDWIWDAYPEFRCITLVHYMIVEMESPKAALHLKLAWCS